MTRFRGLGDAVLTALVPLGLLAGWQVASMTGALPARILPAPTAVFDAALELSASGALWENLAVSAARAMTGLVIGGGIGFVLGLVSGLSRLGERLLDPTLQMVRNVPHLALIPLVIIWFGVEEEARIFLVALGVFFPIYLNTHHGVRTVDPQLIEMARIYGMRGLRLFSRVILPGALPSILVGLRFALGVMWLTLIVAETIAASSGIGHMAMAAREFMRTDVIMLSILIYAALGKLADSATRFLERRWLSWNAAYAGGR
ncbi:MAG: aliphatic sulfonate ABC transporter permease SsuC [Alphaproteobacteria bacterium]|jgi:sulfonate transport system permease protein|nr:aliphatic sulfonate ABC transporter permease SsuC [Alphaproteobacteria bacterium]